MKYHKFLSVFLAGTFLLTGGRVAVAHHSQSGEFDRNSTIEFSGVVKSVEWTNPHGYILIEVAADDGSLKLYKAEFRAPNALYRAGWRKDSVKPGTVVSFSGSKARNPESINVAGAVTLPDGTVAFQGSGPQAK